MNLTLRNQFSALMSRRQQQSSWIDRSLTSNSSLLERRYWYKKAYCLLITILPRFLRCVHLPDYIIHPEHQCAHHIEELEQITSVSQLLASPITQSLQIGPSCHNFCFTIGDLLSLITSVGCLKFGRFLLDLLHLKSNAPIYLSSYAKM